MQTFQEFFVLCLAIIDPSSPSNKNTQNLQVYPQKPIDPPEIIVLMLQTSGQKTTWDGAKTLENHGKKTLPNWKPPDFLKPPTGDQVTQFGGSKTKKEPTRFLQRPLKASPNGLPAFKPLRPLEKPRKSWWVGKNIGIRNFSWRKKKTDPWIFLWVWEFIPYINSIQNRG